MLGPDLRDAYLERLGLDVEPPTADALRRLHRAHVEQVPYETVWLHADEPRGIDPVASVRRIAIEQRGGYCYHLNGAFSTLLADLGYDVVRHVGGVHGPGGPVQEAMANHLVLTVHGLPTDANPSGDWYVDAGLGDALHDPLPLAAGAYDQSPWAISLEATDDGVGDWHLTHDPGGAFRGMSWRAAPADMAAFAESHQFLSTSPDSHFRRVLTVMRRDGGTVTNLTGLVLRRIGAGASEQTLASEAELRDVLADEFGLRIEADRHAALWSRVHAAHEAWLTATQR
jgi:arylamine N-acetyltransferase